MGGWRDGWRMEHSGKKLGNPFPAQDKEQDVFHDIQVKPYEHNHSQRRSSQPALHGHQPPHSP